MSERGDDRGEKIESEKEREVREKRATAESEKV